jgi:ribonuclease-3
VSSSQSPGGDSASQRPVDCLAAHLFEVVGETIDEPLLLRALTHRSYAYENGGLPNNERLEFLGDSVLGLVVTGSLYAAHPDVAEGQLAKLRAAVVNMRALAEVARTLGLGEYILLGRGEECTGGRDKASILADTLEAVIATVYLSAGLPAATAFVHHLLDELMASSASLGAGLDWKTSLQELTASGSLGVPEYRVTEEGPDHQKSFHAESMVGSELMGSGRGSSKKEAEQMAAEGAWTELNRRSSVALSCEVEPARAGSHDPRSDDSQEQDEPVDSQDA